MRNGASLSSRWLLWRRVAPEPTSLENSWVGVNVDFVVRLVSNRCSSLLLPTNADGTEWIIMEQLPGMEMGEA